MKNKITAFLFVMILCAGSVFASDGTKPFVPKYNTRVLVVGQIKYKTPIDLEARKEGFAGKKKIQEDLFKDNWCQPNFSEKKLDIIELPYMEGYFYTDLMPSKGRLLHLNYFTAGIFKKINRWYQFQLPCKATIKVPEDAVYLYIGTFEYDLDYALRVVGFRHLDDYDNAKKELCSQLGQDVELYRGEITFEK